MPLSAKKMCGAAGVNSSSQVSGARAMSLQHASTKYIYSDKIVDLCNNNIVTCLPAIAR